MKNSLSYLSIGLMFLSIYSCKKEPEVKSPELFPNDIIGNFDAFWHGMSRYYCFWDYETTNWDEQYNLHKNKININTTEQDLANIFKEMVKNLRDHHLSIIGDFSNGSTFAFTTQKALNNLEKYHYLLDQNYFENTLFSKLSPQDRQKYETFVFGTLENKYQYVHFPQFNITGWAALNPNFALDMIAFLSNPKPFHKGVIVDLRRNGGGNSDEISLLVGNFIKSPLEYGAAKVKYGPNRNDFSGWLPEVVYPNTQGYNPLPIVVLCDRNTASNGELSTMAFSLLPQATILGDTTFGAFGAVSGPATRKSVIGGSFSLPNGWRVSIASNIFRSKDGNVYEGIGFPPEIYLPLDENLFTSTGRDNQLEAALGILPK
jgi:hypothetical protein